MPSDDRTKYKKSLDGKIKGKYPVNMQDITKTYPARTNCYCFNLPDGGLGAMITAFENELLTQQREAWYDALRIGEELNEEDNTGEDNLRAALYEAQLASLCEHLIGGSLVEETTDVCPNVEVIAVSDAIASGYSCTESIVDYTESDRWLVVHINKTRFKGDKGDTGSKGDKGDTGTTGSKGDTGATGAPGEKGEPGKNGSGIPPIQFIDKPGEPNPVTTITPPNHVKLCFDPLIPFYVNEGLQVTIIFPLDLRATFIDLVNFKAALDQQIDYYIKNTSAIWSDGATASANVIVRLVRISAWAVTFKSATVPSDILNAVLPLIGGELRKPRVKIEPTASYQNFPVSGSGGVSAGGIGIMMDYFSDSQMVFESYQDITGLKLDCRIADNAGDYWRDRWGVLTKPKTGIVLALNCFEFEQPTECSVFFSDDGGKFWGAYDFGSCWQPGVVLEGQKPGIYTLGVDYRPAEFLGTLYFSADETGEIGAPDYVRPFQILIQTNVKVPAAQCEVYDNKASVFRYQGYGTLTNDVEEKYEWTFDVDGFEVPHADTERIDGHLVYKWLTLRFNGGSIIAPYVIRGVRIRQSP